MLNHRWFARGAKYQVVSVSGRFSEAATYLYQNSVAFLPVRAGVMLGRVGLRKSQVPCASIAGVFTSVCLQIARI